MGNIVTSFRNNLFDASTSQRNKKLFLSKKHQNTNRLVMGYFYSSMVVALLQYQLSQEEQKVSMQYHTLKDAIEKDKLELTIDLSQEQLENMNY